MKTKLIQLAFGNIEDPKTQNAKKERWFSSHNTKREHILAKGAWPENWYMFCVVRLKSPFFLTFCLFGSGLRTLEVNIKTIFTYAIFLINFLFFLFFTQYIKQLIN